MAGTIRIVSPAAIGPTDPDANPQARTGLRGVPIWAQVTNGVGFQQVQWSTDQDSNGAFWESATTNVNLAYAMGVLHVPDSLDGTTINIQAQLVESGVPGATYTTQITFKIYSGDDPTFIPFGAISATANVALSNPTAGPIEGGWDLPFRIDFSLSLSDQSGPLVGAQVDWVPDPVNTAIKVFQAKQPVTWIAGNNSWSARTGADGVCTISMFCRSPKMITLKATTPGWEEPAQNTVFFADFYQVTPTFTSPTVILDHNGRLDLNGLVGTYELDLPLLRPDQTKDRKAFLYIKGNRDFVPYHTLDATKLPPSISLPIAELDQKNKNPNANQILLFTQDTTGNMASSQIQGFATDGTSPNVPDPSQERLLGTPAVIPDPGANGTINDDQLAWYDGIKVETPTLDPNNVQPNATLIFNFYLNGYAGGSQVGDMKPWPQSGGMPAPIPVQPGQSYSTVLPKQYCTGYGPPPDGMPWGYFYVEYIVQNPDQTVYYSYYPQYRMST